jgi:hypothetical protein
MGKTLSKPRPRVTKADLIRRMEQAGPTREQIKRFAKTHRPPQSWFDQTDDPFTPEKK